jgi:hypothetical protein
MKTPSFVRVTLRAYKLQAWYREHVITSPSGKLRQQPAVDGKNYNTSKFITRTLVTKLNIDATTESSMREMI